MRDRKTHHAPTLSQDLRLLRSLFHYKGYFDCLNCIVNVVVDSIYRRCISDIELLVGSLHQHRLHIGMEVHKCTLIHTQMHLVAIRTLESLEYNILQCRDFLAHLDSYLITIYNNASIEGLFAIIVLIGIADSVCINELNIEEK